MKILITGGAGYIGSLLAIDLKIRGHNVVVYDNLLYNHGNCVYSAWGGIQFYNQDLTQINDKLKGELVRAKEKIQSARRVFLIGNGGSQSVCSHLSQDFLKTAGILAYSMEGSSLITACANDFEYKNAYKEWLRLNQFDGDSGDVLIVISSSGNSRNILNAMEFAHIKNTIALTAFHESWTKTHSTDIDWSFLREFDAVVHLAAIVGATACKIDGWRAIEVNLELTKKIVDNLNEDQVLIFPNTNSSYGSVPEGICTEETPRNAISLYAQTKDDAEKYVLENHEKSVVFRLATVFGCSPRTRVDLLVNTLVYEAYFNKKIDIFDGGLRRNYVHVQDVVNTIMYAIPKKKMFGQVYNLGLDEANMTKLELATLIGKELDVPVNISEGHDPDRRDYLVSSKKLQDIGFIPHVSLQDGIKELVNFYKMLPKDSSQREQILRQHRNDYYED